MPQTVIDLKRTRPSSRKSLTRPTTGRVWWRNFVVIVLSVIVTAGAIKATDTLSSRRSDQGNNSCPEGMVQVLSAKGDFCIDQFEASVGVTCPRMNPQNQVEVQENLDSNACAPVSVKGGLPWRYISQNQAAIICARAGKRLPSSAEWQQAALGTPDKAGDWQATDCNVAKNWLGAGESGPTGSAENCKSASGAYDMSGNVWEWVVETATDGVVDGKTLPIQGYVQGMNDAGLPSTAADTPSAAYNQDYLFVKNLGTRAVARGGYWGNMTQAGIYATYIVAEPGVSEGGVGFRCVK